jgi:hypothetical protein
MKAPSDHTCQARQRTGPPEIQNITGEALINYSGTTCIGIKYEYVGILAKQLVYGLRSGVRLSLRSTALV